MASELVEMELNGFDAYGMRLNDLFFISFSNKVIDDYAVSVFTKIRAKFHDIKNNVHRFSPQLSAKELQ